jgi:deoxyadenosine/deoxycytidine kinase
MAAKLISIIGPPAVGKTCLAEGLAADLPAEMVREDYAGNPFLADSYVGSPGARLPAQLYFLMSRVKQLSLTTWPAAGVCVSDYGYCMDGVFARLRLGPEDHAVYRRVAERMEGLVHLPDVLIHLDAGAETLADRIARRGRPFESAMTVEFLSAMRKAYDAVEAQASCGVLRVDAEAVDVRQAAARAALAAELRRRL